MRETVVANFTVSLIFITYFIILIWGCTSKNLGNFGTLARSNSSTIK